MATRCSAASRSRFRSATDGRSGRGATIGGEGNTSGSGDERGEAELGARVWAMGGGVKERRRPRDETLTGERRLSSTSSSSSSPSDPWRRSGVTLDAERGGGKVSRNRGIGRRHAPLVFFRGRGAGRTSLGAIASSIYQEGFGSFELLRFFDETRKKTMGFSEAHYTTHRHVRGLGSHSADQ
ncbi:hypothetical protein B0H10DRAFT_1951507 [Mycena sp. CBHHK59/15]|nr:hypothetical protein B0H10DRAFT_1951507 [Mycena sp. CBHHK59/15]